MFNVKWDYPIKKALYISGIVKTTYRKSWPGNLSQVLNFTFDPASRLNGVITLKCLYFSLIIGAMASEYKDRPSKCFA